MSLIPNNNNNNSSVSRKFDVIIYGATGFTGSIVATEFCKRYATSDMNLKWAIGGRNKQKLTLLKQKLQSTYTTQIEIMSKYAALNINQKPSNSKDNYIKDLPLIIADVNDKNGTLRDMILSTTLIMSCVGPYRTIGENIVQICAENGTHYIDICGETDFMERCAYKYYEIARNNGCIIVNACGFDSIPSDMGCLWIDQWYIKQGGICSTINGYITGNAPKGYSAHATTLESAVYSISNIDKLKQLRVQVCSLDEEKQYKIDRKDIIRAGVKQKIRREKYFWSNEVEKWSMVFPSSDKSVVINSQGITCALLYAQGVEYKTYPHFVAYMSVNSAWQLSAVLGAGFVGQALLEYEWGRQLLINYPTIFSLGAFTEDGPSEIQRQSQTFEFRFFANGYSAELCNTLNLENIKPDMKIHATVSGYDMGYSGTALIFIECAICLLEEMNQIKDGDLLNSFPAIVGGVFTPSTVFGNTSLIERLNEAGINFTINEDFDEDVIDLPLQQSVEVVEVHDEDEEKFVNVEHEFVINPNDCNEETDDYAIVNYSSVAREYKVQENEIEMDAVNVNEVGEHMMVGGGMQDSVVSVDMNDNYAPDMAYESEEELKMKTAENENDFHGNGDDDNYDVLV